MPVLAVVDDVDADARLAGHDGVDLLLQQGREVGVGQCPRAVLPVGVEEALASGQ